jgi:hypothetical protein
VGHEIIQKLFKTRFAKQESFANIKNLKIPEIRTEKEIKNMMSRFGCPLFLIISCVLNGGIWANEKFSTFVMQHYAHMEYVVPHFEFSPPNVSPLSAMQDLNLFVRDAISTNYIKEQYTSPTQYHLDYNDILIKEERYPIGAESPVSLRYKFKPTEHVLYIPYQGRKYVPDFILYDNIVTMNESIFDGLIQYYLRQIKRRVAIDERQQRPPAQQKTASAPPAQQKTAQRQQPPAPRRSARLKR